jgi:hypothetical protein
MMQASPVDDEINQMLLWGVQMIHGAVFSKKAPLAAGGKRSNFMAVRLRVRQEKSFVWLDKFACVQESSGKGEKRFRVLFRNTK